MSLKLNTSREAYQEFSKEASGHLGNVDQMPALVADGRVPMSVSGLMQRRLEVRNSDNEVKSAWMDNYFDTGDAVVYHPDGRVKIVLDSQDLRNMTPDTPRKSVIIGGALILPSEVYDALGGKEFKEGKLGKTGDWMSREDAKAHPVWKFLARDQALLNDYADYIFAEGKERFDYDTAMGVFTGSASGDTLEMRAWHVGRLGHRVLFYGREGLANRYGRLVGIAPEVLSASGKVAPNIKPYTMADLQAVDKVA